MDIQTKKNQNFKNKYLKYKSKYLKYKNVNFGGTGSVTVLTISDIILNIIKERELNTEILNDSNFVSIINNVETNDKLYNLQNIFEEIKNDVVPLDLFDSENKLKEDIQLKNIIELMFNYYYIVKGITEIKAYLETTTRKFYYQSEINIFKKLSHHYASLLIEHDNGKSNNQIYDYYDVKQVYESVKLLIEDCDNKSDAIKKINDNNSEFQNVYSECERKKSLAESKRQSFDDQDDSNSSSCQTILNNNLIKVSKNYYKNNVMIQTYFEEKEFSFRDDKNSILTYYVLNNEEGLRNFFKEITEKNNNYDNIIKVCKDELITDIKKILNK